MLPLVQRSTTSYDGVGNVQSTTDFNGQTIQYVYDPNNRLATETFPDGTSATFTYTATGQRKTVTDANGPTTYAYDERDRLLSRTDPDGRTIAYTYDLAGDRTSVTVPSGTTTYSFDKLNRMSKVTGPDGGSTQYTYDAAGRLVKTDLPDGTSETREYDSVNHLLYLENRGPSGIISSYRYTLAKTGRRDAVVEDTGRKVGYQYDLLDRLIDEGITDAVNGNRTIHYAYDPVGNRLSRNDSVQGVTTSAYDANDRLLSETLGSQVTQYAYDANGNTKSKITSAVDQALYEWDSRNRLVGAKVTDTQGTEDLKYRYDVDGIRVASVVDGVETRLLIDANLPYAQVLEEYTPGGVILVSYVHGNDLISQARGGVRSYYHVDGLGSARALTNASGLVTDRYIYDAFGRTIGQVGSTGNVYLFAGEQRNANVGLDYLRARYLSVGTGRFYGRDPFAGSINDPASLHRFAYVQGNPVNLLDPSGQVTLLELVTTTAIRGALSALSFSIPLRAFEAVLDRATGASLGSVARNAAFGVALDAGIGALSFGLLEFAPAVVKLRLAGQSLFDVISSRSLGSIWKLDAFSRGFEVESLVLGRARSLSQTFPVIDDFASGVATSIKSLDATLPSYQSPAAIVSKLSEYASSLSSYTDLAQGTTRVTAAATKSRVLLVAFEQGAITKAQANALRVFLENVGRNPTLFGQFPIKVALTFFA